MKLLGNSRNDSKIAFQRNGAMENGVIQHIHKKKNVMYLRRYIFYVYLLDVIYRYEHDDFQLKRKYF